MGDTILPGKQTKTKTAQFAGETIDAADGRMNPPPPRPNPRQEHRQRAHGGKQGVRQGFGLHDWMNLTRRAKDLAQRKGAPIRRDMSVEEVKAHNKPHDGWMILRGKVYNITPYLAYHPGGSEILERCLGKDASKLFDRYHQWVNIDGLIGTLLIGTLKANEMPCLGEDDEEDESSDEDCN